MHGQFGPPAKGPQSNRNNEIRDVVDIDPQGDVWFKAEGVRGWAWCTPAQWRKWRKGER